LNYNIQYPLTIPTYDFILRIRDYNTTFFPIYSQFKMVAIKEDVQGSFDAALNWVDETFTNGVVLNQDYLLSQGMTTTISIDLKSNIFFQENTYKKNIVMYIYGKNSQNQWELIPEKYIIQIELKVENEEISIVPSPINLVHYKNIPVIPVSITVNAPSNYTWQVLASNPYLNQSLNNHLELSTNDPSVTIITDPSTNSYEARGQGSKIIIINVRAAYWNIFTSNQFIQKFLQINQYIDANTQIFKKHVFVNVNFLINSTVLYLSNESIFFNAIKQISEPIPVLLDPVATLNIVSAPIEVFPAPVVKPTILK
jgi:hypothetical protein